ncbi:hypothetical protein M1P56_21285 [Streptomyces sp. HU2014]|uniref:hypothetical protein n=1 Tax=Streptomyces sp. HU2014 TaxID=2939414 RepID=UPI002010452B|nr:hypothetical protein [Streptomyces sp. HU2014]UQI46701.1 hypothetical protein M1P56_21285 [Streptomyces sp. HU2014]
MVKIPARGGGTIDITWEKGIVDIHVRDRAGRTVATVRRAGGVLGARSAFDLAAGLDADLHSLLKRPLVG